MSALDEIHRKLLNEMSGIEIAIWYTSVATNVYNMESAAAELLALQERVKRLEAVSRKAGIVIAGWEQFGFTSEFDLNVLKEELRKANQ